ncbi:flagellar protein MotY [Pseudomonas profundi]|uniref:flagellar protein MotY n=1 Tax=Pseudomonas profundi TaxID=1981513 RepID=UPI0012387A18|nr:OmpA family protein [Pseudomonas profundi]
MVRLYLAVPLLGLALPALATTYETRMEDVEWAVEGDQFECRLSQAVTGYGEAVFVRRAGEQPTFQLRAWDNLMRAGSASLYNAAPPWRPGSAERYLGEAVVQEGAVMSVPYQQAGQMLAGLAGGFHPTIQRSGWAGSEASVRVVVSSVGYQQAWVDFQECIGGLLPMNLEQIAATPIRFASGARTLDQEARAFLDVVLAYLEADPDIDRIEINGHSDNYGDRLSNHELSRQRALVVQAYLAEHGVDRDIISVRFHGGRYPIADNRTEVGRAANRRVLVSLGKG